MRTAWKKIRYRLEWLGGPFNNTIENPRVAGRDPEACYRLALLLGSLGAMLDRRGRRVALSNLRVAFGDEISSERRAQIVRESYQHFARTMLDFFWSPRLTSQNFSRYVEFTGPMRTAKKIRYRLEWLGLKSATKFLPLLSRKACYRLALLLGSLGAMLDRRGRRVALSNLRVAFGDEISSERRAQIVRESYQHFARTMLDFFWSPRLTSQNFSRYVEFENRERWDEENTRPGKPVIVGCYHYSNFEWLSIVSAFAGLEGVVIAQQFKNPLLDPIFLKLRQRSGHRVAPRKGAVMHLYRALRRGERFALLVDLTISAKLPTVAIKCFGLERCVTFAHVWLHQRTGAPLINVHCEPLPGGRYRVVFHPRIEFPAGASLQEMAQACWDQFEPVVRKNPAPWLWMYKHWRYRPLAANLAAYPFYANISEDFERRLDEGARKLPPMTSKVKLPMVTPA